MAQNLIQLPKTADFKIGGWHIKITDHKIESSHNLFDCIVVVTPTETVHNTRIESSHNLFDCIVGIIIDPRFDRQILYQLEEHGISFETVIEECARELEEDPEVFVWSKYRDRNSWFLGRKHTDRDTRLAFSKSVAGRKITEQIIEKIRSCADWSELYDEMQLTTKFNENVGKRINKELKEQDKAKEEITQCRKT